MQTTCQLWQAVQLHILSRTSVSSSLGAAVEYGILVLPLILVLTVFASHPIYFNLFLYALVVIITALPPRTVRQSHHENSHNEAEFKSRVVWREAKQANCKSAQ